MKLSYLKLNDIKRVFNSSQYMIYYKALIKHFYSVIEIQNNEKEF